MFSGDLANEIIANYKRHGWAVRRLLLRQETRDAFNAEVESVFGDAEVSDSDFDAVWFARASHGKREAWELRLLAEQPYALFEAFEEDESESDREEALLEMENRMRAHMSPK